MPSAWGSILRTAGDVAEDVHLLEESSWQSRRLIDSVVRSCYYLCGVNDHGTITIPGRFLQSPMITKKRVTIREVAQAAGVSVQTVSAC